VNNILRGEIVFNKHPLFITNLLYEFDLRPVQNCNFNKYNFKNWRSGEVQTSKHRVIG
jgi:hypothetical protein